ncbi:putative C-type lectin domain family 20 member A [Halichoeres trimaculatus]|uniref:putative C-type lectin domain family 20 member A n=1 Tax=Halichoeres trimaculatus TaxID=147232 RepID=UPI003D9E7B38
MMMMMMMMMMKGYLTGPLILLLFSSTVSGLGSVVRRGYHYRHMYYTWAEAQSSCRSSYTDLALYYKQSDRDSTYFRNYNAWVGLYKEDNDGDGDGDDDDWTWTNGKDLNSVKYGPNETSSTHTCAYFAFGAHRMYAGTCDEKYFFICHFKESGPQLHYIFISQAMSWSDARQYCKDKHVDLAAFQDVSKLNLEIHEENFPAWIGLHKEEDSFKWSTGVSDYTHWAPGQPGDNGDCVTISSSTKEMATHNCLSRLPFVCFTDNLVLVKENKTWEEALEHCHSMRSPHSHQHYFRYELASVQPGEDQEIVIATILGSDTEEVWAGLRFMEGHWWWVNGADMLYSNLPVCPLQWEHCGALSKNDTVNMLNRDCLEKKNFLCYKLN